MLLSVGNSWDGVGWHHAQKEDRSRLHHLLAVGLDLAKVLLELESVPSAEAKVGEDPVIHLDQGHSEAQGAATAVQRLDDVVAPVLGFVAVTHLGQDGAQEPVRKKFQYASCMSIAV